MVLLAFPHVDEMLLVGQLRLFQHDVDFLHVRAGQRIQVDHGNVLKLCGGGRETTGPNSVLQGAERPRKARLLRPCAASLMPRRLRRSITIKTSVGETRMMFSMQRLAAWAIACVALASIVLVCVASSARADDDYPNHP